MCSWKLKTVYWKLEDVLLKTKDGPSVNRKLLTHILTNVPTHTQTSNLDNCNNPLHCLSESRASVQQNQGTKDNSNTQNSKPLWHSFRFKPRARGSENCAKPTKDSVACKKDDQIQMKLNGCVLLGYYTRWVLPLLPSVKTGKVVVGPDDLPQEIIEDISILKVKV